MWIDKAIFIQNPNSGKARAQNLNKWVDAFSNKYNVVCEVWFTSSSEDFSDFVQKALASKPSIVVSCGGDGTLNLISKNLLHQDVPMGIVPLGSGNGLARHLGIDLDAKKALRQLIHSKTRTIDTGKIAGAHFLNVAGIGYDAMISHSFAKVNKRGIKGYVREVLKHASLELYDFRIESELGSWKGKAPMVCFTNGSQWGGNVQVNKHADLQDGVLECNVFTAKSWITMGYSVFHPNVNNVKREVIKGAEFEIETDCPVFHFDGEPSELNERNIKVEIDKAALKVRF